ncbi:DEAD/DEAH box helicase [bacterium SCSIO 12696]|nr:DEAD/DEAH box helicase [bacterium SCSIO 12696]
MTADWGANLPIGQVLGDVCEQLLQRDELVLQAPPGAGKTTVVPLALLNQPWLRGQKILLLEPRRVAARAAAERMADNLGEKVGETVGYRMRLQTRVSAQTRIEVITEGILTRMLQSDPALEGVAAVIFDEFHERSLDADLGLALVLQGRALFRDDDNPLKVLVMSATLDGERVAELLNNAPIVNSEGRSYPVDVHYGQQLPINQPVAPAVASTVVRALKETSGSMLVFLPGQREINQVAKQLSEKLAGQAIQIRPLYGSLSLEQQRRAIAPCEREHRKIVLSTNVDNAVMRNGEKVRRRRTIKK